mmetsp:Transcript_110644/g.263770  ORF Transcript_110644/g.263770 Transcript_110644/m.263770 type:complete len:301 (+) Transcript_110644:197-1099(+)
MQLAETKTLKQDVLQAQREACQKTQQATLSSCGGPELREEVIGELVGVQLIHCLRLLHFLGLELQILLGHRLRHGAAVASLVPLLEDQLPPGSLLEILEPEIFHLLVVLLHVLLRRLLPQNAQSLHTLLLGGTFVLCPPHTAIWICVVLALVQEWVMAVMIELRCIEQRLLLFQLLLLPGPTCGMVQVHSLLRLLQLLAQVLLVRLHLISQCDHLRCLLDILLVAVLLDQHLLFELLLLNEHHLLLLLLPFALGLHEVLAAKLEHAGCPASRVGIAIPHLSLLPKPQRVVEVKGVALLFA